MNGLSQGWMCFVSFWAHAAPGSPKILKQICSIQFGSQTVSTPTSSITSLLAKFH